MASNFNLAWPFSVKANRYSHRVALGYQDEFGMFRHLGRVDDQVKVLGFRVELEQVETHLRQVYRTESAAAVAWPIKFGTATDIVAFVIAAINGCRRNRDVPGEPLRVGFREHRI